MMPLRSFQFHKGAIRTAMVCEVVGDEGNFNSIKVRLEHNEKIRYYAVGE